MINKTEIEIDDWKEEFWYKVAEWNNAQPEDIDIYANQLEILIEYHIKEQVYQQLQKAREQSATPEQILVWLNYNKHQDVAIILLNKLRNSHSEPDQDTELLNSVKKDWDKQAEELGEVKF